MEVILLERVGSLGTIGSIVNVKNGFARNYLLPQKKALRATEANKVIFESKREEIEKNNEIAKNAAEKNGQDLAGKTFVFISQSSDTGILYGSVSPKDIAATISQTEHKIEKNQVVLGKVLKFIGMHDVKIALHPDVIIDVKINIARTEEEAVRQEKGENVLIEKIDEDDEKDKRKRFSNSDSDEASDGDADAEAGNDETSSDSQTDEDS